MTMAKMLTTLCLSLPQAQQPACIQKYTSCVAYLLKTEAAVTMNFTADEYAAQLMKVPKERENLCKEFEVKK